MKGRVPDDKPRPNPAGGREPTPRGATRVERIESSSKTTIRSIQTLNRTP